MPTFLATTSSHLTCPAPSSSALLGVTTEASVETPRRHRIVSGTFNSPNLFVLEFDDLLSTLRILHDVEAEGPHQCLAYGVSATGAKTVYATTWAAQSTLSSWHFDAPDSNAARYGLTFGNSVDITATGSYVHVQPPPHSSLTAPSYGTQPGVAQFLGSAGGPTGELHVLDTATGLIGAKTTELVFLQDPNSLPQADKTRKALRYGAHSFDVTCATPSRPPVALIADLGRNAVSVYSFPKLDWLYDIKSVEEHDGPRHAVPHPYLPLVFTVTEHTNFVDWYALPSSGSTASGAGAHVGRVDMLDAAQLAQGRGNWRGDTLRFSSDLRYLFATTRGKTEQFTGLLVAYRVEPSADGTSVALTEVCRYATRTSGGKANAIELAPLTQTGNGSGSGRDLLVLTDDELGWIDILEWNAASESFTNRAALQLPPLPTEPQGASHAIWLD